MQAEVITKKLDQTKVATELSFSMIKQTLEQSAGVKIIRRSELSSLSHVFVDGKRYLLGDHRDFYSHPYLAKFIPEQARLGIAWVCLKAGEVLETHVHPIESMILICEGEVEFRGDFRCALSAGDIVAVPRGARHGFCGIGNNGFRGISIQFEQRGIYEDPQNALTKFVEKTHTLKLGVDLEPPSLQKLVARNNWHKEVFCENFLFRLISSGHFSDESVRQKFLAYFQIWSNQFQKAMHLKMALCDDPVFIPIFRRHFMEELNHDQVLTEDRKGAVAAWDAVLDATASWFPNKMLTASVLEKIVIMHLCVEAVAVVFYKFARPALDPENKMRHFRDHNGVDEVHEQLGVELLWGLSQDHYKRLIHVQDEAWAMSEALFCRPGELV